MIHCQNCTSRNSLEREFCWKCGSKLLVTSGAVPLDAPIPFMEEHVLERISGLENSLGMLTKRVDALVEMIERVAASNFIDHTMIETLTDSLETAGIDLKNLEADWKKRIDSRILETEEVDRLGTRMQRVIDSYKGSDRKQFELWIEKSYDLFLADRAKESLHFLKAALKDDPANHELGLLLAEVYFQEKEYGKAKECLLQVLKAHPDHFEAKRKFRGGSINTGNGRWPEERFICGPRIAWFAARRGRAETAGHQTSQYRNQAEAQRASAFFDWRGLLRRGTT